MSSSPQDSIIHKQCSSICFFFIGIGKFTVLDAALTDGSDVGNNFFLEQSSIGKPRAEEVTKYLAELNGDVKGLAIVKVS